MDVNLILKDFIDYLIYYIDSFKTNIVYQISIPFINVIDNIYHVRIIIKPIGLLRSLNNVVKSLLMQTSDYISNVLVYTKTRETDIEINIYFKIIDSKLLELPVEILSFILLPLPYQDIKNVCNSNTEIEKRICKSDVFWLQKLKLETGVTLDIIEMKKVYLNYETDVKLDIIEMERVYLNYGTVWVLGLNNYVDKRNIDPKSNPIIQTYIPFDKKVKSVACGNDYIMLLTYDGELWKLRLESTHHFVRKISPEDGIFKRLEIFYEYKDNVVGKRPFIVDVKCNFTLCLALDDNGIVWHYQVNHGFTKINFPIAIISFSVGDNYLLAIDKNNDLWGWGGNDMSAPYSMHGQIYNVLTNLNVKAKFVVCGFLYAFIIDLDNDVWVCGSNLFGQLGIGDIDRVDVWTKVNKKAKFIACDKSFTMLIDLNDNILASGDNTFGQSGLFKASTVFKLLGRKSKYISCGDHYTLSIDMNDELWGCGRNDSGQLGLHIYHYTPNPSYEGNEKNRFKQLTKVNFPYKVKNVSSSLRYSVLTVLY